MASKKNIPEVRFKGFDGEWEEKELGDIAESFEYGLNAAAIPYDGINKYIRITDIDDETHIFKSDSLTSPGTDLSFADNYKLKDSDLLFARTGASVGKTYHYRASDGLVYYAGFLIRARIKKEFDAEFIFQTTLKSEYRKFINFTSQRSGQPGVNAQEYRKFRSIIPSLPEQSQIGSFFQNLDALITLRQKKLEKLSSLKKAMLEKMFPRDGADEPELRFKGCTGKWERKNLGELYKERNERGNSSLPILSVSIHDGVSHGELDSDTLGKQVRRSEDKSLYKLVITGDLVFI